MNGDSVISQKDWLRFCAGEARGKAKTAEQLAITKEGSVMPV